jgi:hypothetical protein
MCLSVSRRRSSPLRRIKKAHEIGWDATQIVANVSNSVGAVLTPPGLEASTGLISTAYLKDMQDPQWADDQGAKDWNAFMDKYYPDGDKLSSFTTYGYSVAQTMVHILEQAGDDLTRENVLKQAASMKDVTLPLFLPGMAMNTSETDYFPIEQMQLMKFNGERWETFGDSHFRRSRRLIQGLTEQDQKRRAPSMVSGVSISRRFAPEMRFIHLPSMLTFVYYRDIVAMNEGGRCAQQTFDRRHSHGNPQTGVRAFDAQQWRLSEPGLFGGRAIGVPLQ